jgi:hypothetical protein
MIGELTRETGEAIGEYDITQGTLAIDDGNDGDNYDVTFEVGTLIINAVLDEECIVVDPIYVEQILAVLSSEVVSLTLTNTCDSQVGFDVEERTNIVREGFEEGIMPPTGWDTESKVTGAPEWEVNSNYVDRGQYAAWVSYDDFDDSDEWLLSPAFDPSTLNDLSLTFRAYSSTVYYRDATMKVWVTDADGDPVIDFSTEPLWDMIRDEDWNGFEYRTVFVDLSDFAGYNDSIRVAWQYVGINGNPFGLDMIDINSVSDVSWLSTDPTWGPIAAKTSIEVEVILNADLSSGMYFGTVELLPSVQVPVTLHVVGDLSKLYLPIISR